MRALIPLLLLTLTLPAGCLSYREAFEERAQRGDPSANRANRKLACDTMREKAQRDEDDERTRKRMRKMECPFIPSLASAAFERGGSSTL